MQFGGCRKSPGVPEIEGGGGMGVGVESRGFGGFLGSIGRAWKSMVFEVR